MIKPKVVLLIFVSGKIVLTGAKVKYYLFYPQRPPHLRLEMYVHRGFGTRSLTSDCPWPLRSAKRSTLRSTRSTPCLSNSASRDYLPRCRFRCRRRRRRRCASPPSPPLVMSCYVRCPRVQQVLWGVGDGGRGRRHRKSWTPLAVDGMRMTTLPRSLLWRRLPYDSPTHVHSKPFIDVSTVATCTYTSLIRDYTALQNIIICF